MRNLNSLLAGVAALLVASAIAYNGHAGLGASVYQHNQTDLEFLMAEKGIEPQP